jgi:hypothetical protein
MKLAISATMPPQSSDIDLRHPEIAVDRNISLVICFWFLL